MSKRLLSAQSKARFNYLAHRGSCSFKLQSTTFSPSSQIVSDQAKKTTLLFVAREMKAKDRNELMRSRRKSVAFVEEDKVIIV